MRVPLLLSFLLMTFSFHAASAATGITGTPELDMTTIGSVMAVIGSSYGFISIMRRKGAK